VLDVFPKSVATGYFADITRTVVKGKASDRLKAMYAAVMAETFARTGKADEAKKLLESLKANGVEIVEHPGVKPNPVLSHVKAGIEKARANACDIIVAANAVSAG